MVKPAREKIAQLLEGAESTGSFSAETWAPVAGVTLSVDGVGPVKLPVGAAQERALVSVAHALRDGIGTMPSFKATLSDADIDALALYVSKASRGQ